MTVLPFPGEEIEKYEPKFRFPLLWFDDISVSEDARYLIDGLIPLVGLTLVWGRSKCGKTFWVFDAMMHVALGKTYRNRRVESGVVIYCVFEAVSRFKDRVEAFRQEFLAEDASDIPFALMGIPMKLVEAHEQFIREMTARLGGKAPKVVVLDTLNKSFEGSESSDADMTAYITAADAIRAAFDCAVIIVHHCGHDEKRPRGHSALPAAIDAELSVKQVKDKLVDVSVTLMKDGPTGAKLRSRLKTVTIGLNKYGDPITSCVVIPEDEAGGEDEPSAKDGVDDVMLRALTETIVKDGTLAPEGDPQVPQGATVVPIEDWRERAYAMGISGSGDKAAMRMAFKRSLDRMTKKGTIQVKNDLVWIP